MTLAPDCFLLPKAAQRVERWKNGGGRTRTVAIDPPDADLATGFRWRVSVADVAADGPFSVLPGIDRSLWLLAGNGVRLQCGESATVALRERLQRLDFVGEAAITATLLDGPVQDLNVMTRRLHVHAVAVVGATFVLEPAPQQLVLALRGSLEVAVAGRRVVLGEGDALRVDTPAAVVVGGGDADGLGVSFFAARR